MSAFEIKTAEAENDIRRCFPVMQVLRPHLKDADEFLTRARRQQAQSGWKLIYVEDGGVPVACSGFRISEWLSWGKSLYVDDLICLERSTNALRPGSSRRNSQADGYSPACGTAGEACPQGPRHVGLLPVPQGEIALVQSGKRAAHLQMLRLRQGRRRLQMADGNRRSELP